MEYESQISLGRIAKIHGNEGSVSVQLEKEFIDNIPEMESVFLEIEGKLVPFFISHIEYAGGTIARLQFDGYREFDKISEFNGCRVFLTSTPEEYHQSLSSPDLTGFRIFSSGDEYLGTIAKITDNPGQTLLSVISAGGKEVLIPLHEDLIVRIIKGKKKIIMELPEGLAELNT
jgi:16S rRNA processing protein RimM